jgi:hypothetical protein
MKKNPVGQGFRPAAELPLGVRARRCFGEAARNGTGARRVETRRQAGKPAPQLCNPNVTNRAPDALTTSVCNTR